MKVKKNSIYQIKVQGKLNQQWSKWLAGMTIRHDQTGEEILTTTLTGPIIDQAALRGILNKLWDLNLTLLSVRQLGAHQLSHPPSSALVKQSDPVRVSFAVEENDER
jgi:hypothetical protein